MRSKVAFICLISFALSGLGGLYVITNCSGYYPGNELAKLSQAVWTVLHFVTRDRQLTIFLMGTLSMLTLVSGLLTASIFIRSDAGLHENAKDDAYPAEVQQLRGLVADLQKSLEERGDQLGQIRKEYSELQMKAGMSSNVETENVRAELERLKMEMERLVAESKYQQDQLKVKAEELERCRDDLEKAQKELEQSKTAPPEYASKMEQLEHAFRDEQSFVSTVSHELKNPLAIVIGYVSLLVKRWKNFNDEKKMSYLQIVETEMDRLSRLVNGLLELSRIQQGRAVLNVSRIDLQSLVQRVLDPLQLKSSNLFFALEFPVKPLVLEGDEDRLKQVFFNLLSNATKYTPSAGRIAIQAQETSEGIQVSVTNDGPPIPKEAMPNMFQKFYRVQSEINKKIPGTGLGLSVCKAIVELHGGRIWVDPDFEQGARFIFTLPLVPPQEKTSSVPAADSGSESAPDDTNPT